MFAAGLWRFCPASGGGSSEAFVDEAFADAVSSGRSLASLGIRLLVDALARLPPSSSSVTADTGVPSGCRQGSRAGRTRSFSFK